MQRRESGEDELLLVVTKRDVYGRSIAQVVGRRGRTVICVDRIPEQLERTVGVVRPVLVVMDSGGGTADPSAVLRAVAEAAALHVPIIVLAADDPQIPLPGRCIVLAKPVAAHDLLDAIEALLA